jgi:hypothetical protein
MGYQIIDSTPPVVHEGGRIELSAAASGTNVVWTTTFRLAVPLLGGVLALAMAPLLRRGFRRGLAFVKHELER